MRVSDNGTGLRRVPLAVVIALAIIAVGGLILAMNWLLGTFFAVLRWVVLAAVVVVLGALVIAAKARR